MFLIGSEMDWKEDKFLPPSPLTIPMKPLDVDVVKALLSPDVRTGQPE